MPLYLGTVFDFPTVRLIRCFFYLLVSSRWLSSMVDIPEGVVVNERAEEAKEAEEAL